MLLVLFFVSSVLCYIIGVLFFNRYKRNQCINRLPGPKSYPFIGSVLEVVTAGRHQRIKISYEWNRRYGYLFRIWAGPLAVVAVNAPEYIEAILTSTSNVRKAKGYDFFEEWLGTGLLTSTGAKWHTRRKMLTPAFHFSILKTYFDTFVENSEMLTKKLENEIESSAFDIYPYINNCTLDIISETAMGVKINAQSNTSDYINSIKDISEIFLYRLIRPWLWPQFIYYMSSNYSKQKKMINILHTMSYNIIRQRKEERIKNHTNLIKSDFNVEGKEKKAFLDLLLDISEQSTERLSDTDIREEVDTFMFEGHDTTSAAIMWAIFLIGSHQNVQGKIVEELNLVFGKSDRNATFNDMHELKYLECVIKESLRLFPAVPWIGRTLDEDVNIDEYLIPKRTVILMDIFILHRHPKHFPEPEKFDPSRFLPENALGRHPFAFVPFSGGPRNCIGQKFAMLEEKVILSSILRKYNITSVDRYEDLVLIPESVLRSHNGIRVKISKRL